MVVIGGACDDFTYETMNKIFRRLMDGASLVGMHRNLFWKTSEGWELDGGAYIAGLEEAANTKATICGKPEKAYFDAALAMLGVQRRPRGDGGRRHRQRHPGRSGVGAHRDPGAHREVSRGRRGSRRRPS